MTPLERMRADQHNDLALPSDHALYAFLAESSIDVVRLDMAPKTSIEISHLRVSERGQ